MAVLTVFFVWVGGVLGGWQGAVIAFVLAGLLKFRGSLYPWPAHWSKFIKGSREIPLSEEIPPIPIFLSSILSSEGSSDSSRHIRLSKKGFAGSKPWRSRWHKELSRVEWAGSYKK